MKPPRVELGPPTFVELLRVRAFVFTTLYLNIETVFIEYKYTKVAYSKVLGSSF